MATPQGRELALNPDTHDDGHDRTLLGTGSRGPLPIIAAALAVLVLALAALVVMLALRDSSPADDSVDAGFARDMSIHHAQAVQMASIVYRRTDDPEIQLLAYDILTTQQAQIGQMSGWLQGWELLPNGTGASMAWMGHEMTGDMPGMATDDEVASLETLPLPEMNRTFLRLMIRHHQGALDMAIYASEKAEVGFVRTSARFMATGQQGEITTMESMLSARS